MTKKASPIRDAFLFCVSQTGNLTVAADFAGVTRAEMIAKMAAEPAFAQCVEEAKQEAFDRLLYQAMRRAVTGVEVPQYYQGELIGHTQKRSDSLLRYMLNFLDAAHKHSDVTHDSQDQDGEVSGLQEMRDRIKARLNEQLASLNG